MTVFAHLPLFRILFPLRRFRVWEPQVRGSAAVDAVTWQFSLRYRLVWDRIRAAILIESLGAVNGSAAIL